jgi:hypothetical protein
MLLKKTVIDRLVHSAVVGRLRGDKNAEYIITSNASQIL